MHAAILNASQPLQFEHHDERKQKQNSCRSAQPYSVAESHSEARLADDVLHEGSCPLLVSVHGRSSVFERVRKGHACFHDVK